MPFRPNYFCHRSPPPEALLYQLQTRCAPSSPYLPPIHAYRRISGISLPRLATASYQSLRTIWFGSESGSRADLSSLLAGSNFVFTSPAPRQKSEELKARLRSLEEAAERKAYHELVKDITPRKPVNQPFSSYKDQLGFGLHVVVTMFTGYLVGYAAFRALFGQSPTMSAAVWSGRDTCIYTRIF